MSELPLTSPLVAQWLMKLAGLPRDEQYLTAMMQSLTDLPGTRLAFVTECLNFPVTDVAVLAQSPDPEGPSLTQYELAGTLCANVIHNNAECRWQPTECGEAHEFGVEVQVDAHAPLLYMGALMRRSNGRPLGHVTIFVSPDSDEAAFSVLLKTASAQMAPELERRQNESNQAMLFGSYYPLFDNSFLSVLVYEAKTLRIIESNGMACHMYGCTRDEILAMTIADICPTEDLPRMLTAVQTGGGTVDPTSVWRHIKKDGAIMYVNLVGHLFSWRGKRYCLALVNDVTEKRRLEMERAHAYQEMEARLKDTILVQERNRLARDLHDAVSQTLWSAKLISERLPDTLNQDAERGRTQFTQLQNLIDSALSEMRTLLLELRPAALEEIALAEALRRLTDVVRTRTGLILTYESDYESLLPAEVQTAFYRIAQEAMNNCVRHSSCVSIFISLMQVNSHIELAVRDDGCGFDTRESKVGHYGLSIMRERAETAQAIFVVDSQVGKGTCIRVQYLLDATT